MPFWGERLASVVACLTSSRWRAIAIVREEFELTLRLLATPTPAHITRAV